MCATHTPGGESPRTHPREIPTPVVYAGNSLSYRSCDATRQQTPRATQWHDVCTPCARALLPQGAISQSSHRTRIARGTHCTRRSDAHGSSTPIPAAAYVRSVYGDDHRVGCLKRLGHDLRHLRRIHFGFGEAFTNVGRGAVDAHLIGLVDDERHRARVTVEAASKGVVRIDGRALDNAERVPAQRAIVIVAAVALVSNLRLLPTGDERPSASRGAGYLTCHYHATPRSSWRHWEWHARS